MSSNPRLPSTPASTRRPGLVLAAVALAQLTVVLDGTIVSVALPRLQTDLGLADADRQWAVTAYALAFGACLLLGGRVCDRWGRERAFVVGMSGFAVASALGGAAGGVATLVLARAGQGVFAALLAPAALSLLTVTFPTGRDRTRAFAVFGAVSAGGAAVGLVLGGLLTEFLSWRWCFLVNLPVAAAVVALAVPALRPARPAHRSGPQELDVLGAVTVAAGLSAVVVGVARSERGWTGTAAVPALLLGVVLLAVFAVLEHRHRSPLLPLSVVAHRGRGTAMVGLLVTGGSLVGGMLQLTFYLQGVRHYSPLQSGAAVLPLTAGVALAGTGVAAVPPRLGVRLVTVIGALVAAGGFAGLSAVGEHTAYVSHVLPWVFLIGVGLGATTIPLQSTALAGVPTGDAGAASAATNATQQVGGAVGTALVGTVAASAATTGPVQGFSTAFTAVAVVLAAFAAVAVLLMRSPRTQTGASERGTAQA